MMPLKLGQWRMNDNGFETTLSIQSVDGGAVTGSLGIAGAGNPFKISGIWDETSQKLVFAVEAEAPAIEPAIYQGFLFSTPGTGQPGADIVWTLTGYQEVVNIKKLQGNTRRNRFGWYAQITEVV
jgi:hypothetical protein